MKYYISAFACLLLTVSCGFLKTKPSNEPDLGSPKNKFDVNIDGDNLYRIINMPISNDTMINLFSQMGKHKYSNSRDDYFPYPTTDMSLYYEFENGISLSFSGPDAGSNDKQAVMDMMKKYPTGFRLEQISIDNKVYRGKLPKGILNTDSPIQVEEKVGKYNEFFKSNVDQTERVEYFYPHLGLDIRFNFFPREFSPDSSIQMIIITDSITEMKRFPAIYTRFKE